MTVRFGDYKKVQGRMVNHSVEWDGDDGKTSKSAVSNVSVRQAGRREAVRDAEVIGRRQLQ